MCTHARSLWRLEPLRIRCGGGEVGDSCGAWEGRKGLEGDWRRILEGFGGQPREPEGDLGPQHSWNPRGKALGEGGRFLRERSGV